MQTFLPYPDFAQSASVLDYRRLGSQIHEVNQLLDALHETNNGGYRNHPVTNMWRGCELQLCGFGLACEEEWESRGYKVRVEKERIEQHFDWAKSGDVNIELPWWFGDPEVHKNYQRRLYTKDPAYYGAHFGTDLEPLYEFPYPQREA